MWVAVYTRAHARHAVEEVHHVKRRTCQRVVGHLGDGDRRVEGLAAIGGGGDDLQAGEPGRVGVLCPEGFNGAVGGDGHLAGLAEALSGVVVGRAHLHGLGPGAPLVIGVCDVELDAAVAGAGVAEVGPVDIDTPKMRAAGEVINGDPIVVVEIGFVIGGGGRYRIGPGRAVIVGTGDGDLLAAELREGISQAAVVDGNSAGEAERAVGAAPGTVVQAGVAAGDPANGIEARQEAAGPRLAIIGRAVIGRGRDARSKGAWAGKWGGGVMAERLLNLVVGPRNQDARHWVAGDGGLVLLIL
ncbi:MAG: hypothetical protein E6J04_02980 [Chloroflexi bacterium]|nr:MAG: hypothetical protein E6J04_02980 [Chloroflexota bacterium]